MNPRRNIQRKRKARKKMDRYRAMANIGRVFNTAFGVIANALAVINAHRAKRPIPNFKPGGIVVPREGGELILPETPSRPIR